MKHSTPTPQALFPLKPPTRPPQTTTSHPRPSKDSSSARARPSLPLSVRQRLAGEVRSPQKAPAPEVVQPEVQEVSSEEPLEGELGGEELEGFGDFGY